MQTKEKTQTSPTAETIQLRLDISLEEGNATASAAADDSNDNNTDADTPTPDEMTSAASTPVLAAVTRAADTAKKAHEARRDDISARASKAAWTIVGGINGLAAAPTARNREYLTAAIATALHVISVATREGITARSRAYITDYTPKNLTGMLVAAARAILSAHDDGRRDDETYLSALYADMQKAVEKATDNIPIAKKTAAALTAAIDELNEAVTNT